MALNLPGFPPSASLSQSGPSADAPDDIVTLLLECHERIRRFTALAQSLSIAQNLPDSEVADAAQAVWRYFTQALPLHVQDEEEDVCANLKGRSSELDAALERMGREHDAHQPLLARLIECCAALHAQPQQLGALRPELAEVANALSADFALHLEAEERTIIPALTALLTAQERAQLADRLRARRHRAWRTG